MKAFGRLLDGQTFTTIDYSNKLTQAEKDFLYQFDGEFYCGWIDKKHGLHDKDKYQKDLNHESYARRHDVLNQKNKVFVSPDDIS